MEPTYNEASIFCLSPSSPMSKSPVTCTSTAMELTYKQTYFSSLSPSSPMSNPGTTPVSPCSFPTGRARTPLRRATTRDTPLPDPLIITPPQQISPTALPKVEIYPVSPCSSPSGRARTPLRRATTRETPLTDPLITTSPQQISPTALPKPGNSSVSPCSSPSGRARTPLQRAAPLPDPLITTLPQQISPTALPKVEISPVSPCSSPSGRARTPLRRAATRETPLPDPLITTPPQQISPTALPKVEISPVSPCSSPSDHARTPLRCAVTRETPLPDPLTTTPPQQSAIIKPSPCCNKTHSNKAHTPEIQQSPTSSQLAVEAVDELAHLAALKRVCNSSLRVPSILSHDIYPKSPPAPYKVTRNCPVPYSIKGINIDGCIPSKYIHQEHLSPVKEVLAKYSYLIKKDARLVHICKLCIKLAKEAIFGVSMMMMCSTSEKGCRLV